jgi:hypothetical protein
MRLAARTPNSVRSAFMVIVLGLVISSSEIIDVSGIADTLGDAKERSGQGSPKATCKGGAAARRP